MITAGRSDDLDALAAYLSGLGKDTVKRSPFRQYNGELSELAQRGQEVFNQLNCQSCHSGNAYRDGSSHDVGTITGQSGDLDTVRTPTLIELWDSAPFFHDGSAGSLAEVLSTVDHRVDLPNDELEDLVEFLLSIDRDMFIDDNVEFVID